MTFFKPSCRSGKTIDILVPGGEKAVGKMQAYGDIRKTYDIDREEVNAQVDAYWWRSCPKLAYPCKIKLYEGGEQNRDCPRLIRRNFGEG